ncbi:DUF6603 domain-containing protein [Actinomadura sp. NTSP31]|uniref:DUF6603 domain-containing protein n=1 Tax=Actinomadura sp. NTSP31 TaxID=1735447 RepID=UPI0035C0008C
MTRFGTFETVLAEVGQALLPLRDALATPAAAIGLLRELGWATDTVPAPLTALGTSVDTLHDALRRVLGDGGVNEGGTVGDPGAAPAAGASADDAARVLAAVQGLVTAVRAIANAPASAIPPALAADGFAAKFPPQLLDHLVITYLRRFHPRIAFALRALGVSTAAFAPAQGNRPAYTLLALEPARASQALADPSVVLRNAFGWGTPDLDTGALTAVLDDLLMTLGFDVRLGQVSTSAVAAIQGPDADTTVPPADVTSVIAFDRAVGDDARTTAVVRLLPVPAGPDGSPPGLALLPEFAGELGASMALTPDLTLTVRSDLDLQGGVGLVARPGRGIDMILGFESAGVPVHDTGTIEVVAERTVDDGDQPTLVFGSPDGTRLQFKAIGATGGVRLAGDDVDVFAELDVHGLEFVLKPDDADGFIAAILPADGVRFGADLAVGVSHRSGFYFRGTSNLEIQLPVRERIGPLEIQGLTIAARPSGAGVPVDLGASFTIALGPVTAVVDRIGLTATFTGRPDHDGNLGPVDVAVRFKPPGGVGLSVDTGVVSGGGFLAFDPAQGQYAGAVELEFAGLLALKGIGLITTGDAGFSLLVVLSADFGDGIQLGYGFRLLEVGGLIGLNRGMDLKALVEGVRTGAIESVAFPKDIVANAPRILSDLARFFPQEQGTFLIGPMAKIGWGTPTLVSVSLGVIIEIPGDIAVLGVLRAALPTEELQLLVLQVDFVGALEADRSRLWFFAKLFDSRILTMTIDGGMGLLVAWGDNPDLVLTVGGFHPAYRPPPLPFPVPERLSVDILNQPGRLIRVSGYFALTGNTVQFGARAELRLSFSDFRIEGHLAFDALFHFSPFAFVIDISAGVSLKAFGVGLFGIDLRFRLEGPAPWRAHGRGSIGFLFFEISADFDITWGESRVTTLPPVDVLPLLAAELHKIESWVTLPPAAGTKPLVNLRPLPPAGDPVLHPLGTLVVRQRALPLDVRVDRIGAQKAADGRRFSVAPGQGSGLSRASVTGDRFAMAQFQTMDDAAKLSRPSYETQDAGIELAAAAGTLASPRVVRRSTRYELHIVDSGAAAARTAAAGTATAVRPAKVTAAPPKRFHNVNPAVFGELLRGGSTARSPLSRREALLRQPFATADTVRVVDQRYVVAYVRSNLQAFPPGSLSTPTSFRSRTTAADALAQWVDADPALAGRLHVIAESEAAASPAPSGTWSDAGAMPAAAEGVDAVPLATGKVLVAGGADGTGTALATASLFDPTGNAWAATGPMTAPRSRHTTTLLNDGRVLAAGGTTAGGTALASAEIYDPAAGTWTAVPAAMRAARAAHSATVLPDGRVLVTGGAHGAGALASAELFDPATRTWTAALPMIDARSGHRAVPVPGGRVLVAGGVVPTGDGGDRALARCEIYDPVTGAWSATGDLAAGRKGHQATVLADGRVLVTGGDPVAAADGTFSPHSLASAELFDPAAGTWAAAAPLPGGGRSRHRCLLLGSGAVLLIGGTGGPAFASGHRSVLVYDPDAGTWTPTGALTTGRWSLGAVQLSDLRVLAAGGVAAAGPAAPGPGTTLPAATAEVLIP